MKNLFTLFVITVLGVAQAQAQAVQLNYSQLDFGTLTYGEADSIQVEVTNLLNEEIALSDATFFSVYNSSPFYITSMPATVGPLATTSFYVVFKPVHNIAYNSEMVLNTGGNRGAVSLDLLGNCIYPESYYDPTYNLKDEALEEALHTLLAQNYQDYGYNGARDRIFMEIDNKKVNGQGASQNTITRVYLGTDAVGYTSRANAQSSYNLNTEHTFPQGNFNSNLPMKADMHHLFVTDVDANSARGNLRFGNVVSGVNWTGGDSKRGLQADGELVFEPRDPQKGPAARAVLYFVIRYQNFGGFLNAAQEQTLREWSEMFPPDVVQKNRNEDVFDYQHNRNPFVDYPQMLDRIYNIRINQNRPNVGALAIATEQIDFGPVVSSTETTYNLVLTNYGERYIMLSNLAFTENATGSFDFAESLPANVPVYPGESISLPVSCYSTSAADDLEAFLHFTTNLPETPEVNLPVTASFVTGVSTITENAAFVLAPNPASTVVALKYSEGTLETIKIYDIAGRICFSADHDVNQLDISGLNRGIYQVVATFNNGTTLARKLVKQ